MLSVTVREIVAAKVGLPIKEDGMGGTRVGPQARREYLAQMRDRYQRAPREAKGRVLDEVCEVTGQGGGAGAPARDHRPLRPRGPDRPVPEGEDCQAGDAIEVAGGVRADRKPSSKAHAPMIRSASGRLIP